MARRNDWQNDPWDDAPAHVRERLQDRGRAARRRLGAITGTLALLAAGLALFTEYASGLRSPSAAAPEPSPTGFAAPAAAYSPPPEPAAAVQSTTTITSAPIPEPLENCLQEGEALLDNRVARCRYGRQDLSAPQSARQQPAQGMVSAEYLARYRAERDSRTSRTSNVSVEHSAEWVRRDDGSQYLAEWEVRNNRIDYGSVCQNHRKGSIEYRECRKAAKQWYHRQCRRWDKRWDHDRQDFSKQMRERYCSAANGFSPMG